MPDNPRSLESTLFALPSLRTLDLVGRDAIGYAQSQFMNDVASLVDGAWQFSGWLDPKGRVQALFLLIRVDAERVTLVTASDVDTLAGGLKRFVFRSKVAVEPGRLHAAGAFDRPLVARGSRIGVDAGSVELDLSGDGGARTLWLSESTPGGASDEAAWWACDVAHGWPGIPGAALDSGTPQQLSLDRLNAYSVKKGCYPGQEIVARTHFLGRAKRGLARIRVAGAVAGDALVDVGQRDVGRVVCAVGDEALAVLPLDIDAGSLTCNSAPVAGLELRGGLAR